MNVLAPLVARYAYRRELPAEETALPQASPEQVRAMPIVLRLEKAEPPDRTPLLEADPAAAWR